MVPWRAGACRPTATPVVRTHDPPMVPHRPGARVTAGADRPRARHGRYGRPVARVAVVGLGAMGRGIAARLLEAGHDLAVHNRTESKAADLVAGGARLAPSPAAAARGAEVIVVMVADDDASRVVWTGPDGVLAGRPAPAALAVECSTLSHEWVAVLARDAREAGLRYLDCPVTGLPDAAAAGRLTLLVGARDDDLLAAGPFLRCLGEPVHFGPVGAGTTYKLMVNLMGAVQIGAAAEGLALAERAGLDLGLVERALAGGQAASPQVVRNVRRMVEGDHADPVTFSTRLRRKDAAYGVRLAAALGVDVPIGRAALARLDEALTRGLGGMNESAVVEVARGQPPDPSSSRRLPRS